MTYKYITTFTIFLFLISVLTGCSVAKEPITESGFYFNTVITITLYDSQDTALLEGAFALCEAYEKQLSRTIPGSDVWNINHSGGGPTAVSEDTAYLIRTALEYCSLTDGAIDITVAPLSDLWDFSSEGQKKVPSDDAIKRLLPDINYKNISIDGSLVTLNDKNAAIDLGFIAKGYIADKIKEYLVANNVKSAIVNLGGNVITIGGKSDHSDFNIGIQKPFEDRNSIITSVPSSDSSVVSSGVYERYFIESDILYHHILNPKTGYPYENNLLGVTILSKTSLQGDALSTTCFVMGLEDGMALIESLPDVEAVFITDDYQLHYSSTYKH